MIEIHYEKSDIGKYSHWIVLAELYVNSGKTYKPINDKMNNLNVYNFFVFFVSGTVVFDKMTDDFENVPNSAAFRQCVRNFVKNTIAYALAEGNGSNFEEFNSSLNCKSTAAAVTLAHEENVREYSNDNKSDVQSGLNVKPRRYFADDNVSCTRRSPDSRSDSFGGKSGKIDSDTGTGRTDDDERDGDFGGGPAKSESCSGTDEKGK